MEEQDFERLNDIHNMEVLIISPEVDFCLLMKAFFLRKRCRVHITHTEAEALSKLSEIQPDVIFIDRWVCLDIDAFVDRIRALSPDAKVIVQNSAKNKELTPRENKVAEQLIEGKPVTNHQYLQYIFIFIILLAVLQLIFRYFK